FGHGQRAADRHHGKRPCRRRARFRGSAGAHPSSHGALWTESRPDGRSASLVNRFRRVPCIVGSSDLVSREQVLTALGGVLDPELGMSVVELGLIYDVAIADGAVKIAMTLTAPGCPVHAVMLRLTPHTPLSPPHVPTSP